MQDQFLPHLGTAEFPSDRIQLAQGGQYSIGADIWNQRLLRCGDLFTLI